MKVGSLFFTLLLQSVSIVLSCLSAFHHVRMQVSYQMRSVIAHAGTLVLDCLSSLWYSVIAAQKD